MVSGSTDGAPQGVDKGTSGRFAGIATPHHVGQDALHCPKVGNLRRNVREVIRRELSTLGTGSWAVLVGEGEQRADFVEGKPEFARAPDKAKCARLGRAVDPPPAGGSRRRRSDSGTKEKAGIVVVVKSGCRRQQQCGAKQPRVASTRDCPTT
jgi:hypothetical protein